MARPSCLELFRHLVRRDDSRAICTAGKSNATNTPMIAITTKSSTSVNPDLGVNPDFCEFVTRVLPKEGKKGEECHLIRSAWSIHSQVFPSRLPPVVSVAGRSVTPAAPQQR